jgi:hypothetical protein
MSTETKTSGQIVQYRKVGKFELIQLVMATESAELWESRQLTGTQAKATKAQGGIAHIWLAR